MTGRVLALDVGYRRIGVAVSDPLGITAQPLTTIQRTSNRAAVGSILELARSYAVSEVVVGIPYNARGGLTAQGEKIARFADLLARSAVVTVVRWDERHTTATAERVLLEADVSRARRKGVRDKLAAAVLLQDYLRAREGRPPVIPNEAQRSEESHFAGEDPSPSA
jgi:putative Holliday junction resolvase